MKKQDEPKNEIKSIESFELALKPFLDKRSEAERRLIALREGLTKYQAKLAELDKAVALAVSKFQDDIAEGKQSTKSSEAVLSIRQEKDAMVVIVADLETVAIPKAEDVFKRTQAELLANLKVLLKPLHDEFALKMSGYFSQAGKVWTAWAFYLDKLIPSLNLQGMTWFDKEAFYILTPVRDEDMSRYLELINR